ncbi:hypothetical protein Goari_022259, partial [Gossypium aridum]|nr:hypothetical protein [Gossypium aridum]
PTLSHLFFADDLVIFSKKDLIHCGIIKEEICANLGFQQVQDLGRYLGIPLFHQRSIAKVWPLLKYNMIWSVGDDTNIRCWKDAWVPNVGPLINHVSAHANVISNYKLNEVILKDGSWNLDLFRLWLPEEIIHLILSKVRHFLWLTLKQRLLTNTGRVRRRFRQDKLCPLCRHGIEHALHVLRDCPTAKDGKYMNLNKILKVSFSWVNQYTSTNKCISMIDLSDNLEVVNTICDNRSAGPHSSLVRRIQQIFSSKDRWFLRYSPRENNQVVDTLAKLAHNNDEDLCISDKPPVENQAALEEDSLKEFSNLNISM